MRDYGKVYSTFWSSQTTSTLTDDGKLLALYLLTCSHNTIAGVFRLPDGYVSEDLGWPIERVAKGFDELFAKGFANRCVTTKWVWICRHMEWNKPENPNQCKSAAKIAQGIPDECFWKPDFMRVCGGLLGLVKFQKPNRSETVAKPLLNQKQEQEQEQEQEQNFLQPAVGESPPTAPPDDPPPTGLPGIDPKPASPPKAGAPACPHADILALWAEVMPELPQHDPALWTGSTRADHLRARWRATATAKGWRTKDDGLRYFRKLFGWCRKSDFLMGKTAPAQGRRPFELELAWLVNATNWAKVHEGKFNA